MGGVGDTVLHETYEIIDEPSTCTTGSCTSAEGVPAGRPIRGAALMPPEYGSPWFAVVGIRRGGVQECTSAPLLLHCHQAGRGDAAPAPHGCPVRAHGEGERAQWTAESSPRVFRAKDGGRDAGFRIRMQRRPLSILRGCCPQGRALSRDRWLSSDSPQARGTWSG